MLKKHRNGAEAAQWRRLSQLLHHDLPRETGPRSALLVTPTRTPAGAFASMQLAISMSEQLTRTVVLVDASPSNPELTRMLGWNGSEALIDAGRTAGRFDEVTLPTSRENLLFVPDSVTSEWGKSHPDEGARPFLRETERHCDFLLLFGGSVYDEPLVRPLAPEVGCVLLLVIENLTRKEDLEAARETLEAARARKIALVLSTDVYDPGEKPFLSFLMSKGASRPETP